MQTIAAIVIGLFTLIWVVPLIRTLWRWFERLVTGTVAAFSLTLKAVPAMAVSLPMILGPEDVPVPYRPWTPLSLDTKPNLVSGWKIRAMALNGGLCRAALVRANVRASLLNDAVDSDNCHIRNRVRLAGLSKARLSSVDTQCEIAARLYLWERHVLQPAAKRLMGAGIARIEHFSSYSCRKMNTSSGTSSRWSQHATANAIDISGFVLTDGRRISLLRDWKGTGAKATFLREARDGLCTWFNVVLSPDYNALHADHFHADMGPFLSCR